MRPNVGSDPVEVSVQFYRVSVIEVNDAKFTISLKLLLRIWWDEPRLYKRNTDEEPILDDTNGIWVDGAMLGYLWRTDWYLYQFKENAQQADSFLLQDDVATKGNKYKSINLGQIQTIQCNCNIQKL